jgi:hypothetical protein
MLGDGLLLWSLGPLEARQPTGNVRSHMLSCCGDQYDFEVMLRIAL